VTVGVDDTGHDVKFYGATSGKYMEWDESADTLNVVGLLTLHGGTRSVQVTNDSNNANIIVGVGSDTASKRGSIIFERSDGTIASPTAVDDNDYLGELVFKGYDGDQMVTGARIRALCNGTTGNNDMPAELVFMTTADGASDSTARMTIAADGKVGIGTSAPEQNLTVKAQNREISIGDSGLNNYPELRAHATGDKTSYAHMLYGAYTHTFRVSGANKFYVGSGSYANIYGIANNQGAYIRCMDSDGDEMGYMGSPNNDDMHLKGVATNSYLYLGAGGNYQFYSSYAANSGFYPYVDNYNDLGTSGRRWDDVYATNGTIQTSDVNLKKDITNATLGLDFINALRPVEYKWKEGSRKHQGFIAQEVKTVLDAQDAAADQAMWGLNTIKEGTKIVVPVEDENGIPQKTEVDNEERQSLRYTELIAPLVKAVQELTTRVAALEG